MAASGDLDGLLSAGLDGLVAAVLGGVMQPSVRLALARRIVAAGADAHGEFAGVVATLVADGCADRF